MATTTSTTTNNPALYFETPLQRSDPLSKLCERDVYLKLDALQPSGSFKDRGMAHLCLNLVQQHHDGSNNLKLVSSSGGNAGLAVTTVAGQLNIPVQVIVPKTTKQLVIEKLETLGAHVVVHGENWNQADELARQLVEENVDAEYVSPYDNSLLWTGHSTLVNEVLQQVQPSAIVASVGGGGLICGILEGLDRNHHCKCTLVTAETEGAASFAQSWHSQTLISLETIDSVATSLGALQVTPVALERCHDLIAKGGAVQAQTCTDQEAIEAIHNFCTDHRMLVEPACGAALAMLYSNNLRPKTLEHIPPGPIVVEVCGGSGVNLALMQAWKEQYMG